MKILLFASCIVLFGCSARASNSTDNHLRRMQREINNLKKDYGEKIRSLETYYDGKIATLEHQLGSRVEVPVAFSTRLTENMNVNDSPVRFDVVDLNIGDGYNEFTGGFRAPVDGVYQFTFYGLVATGNRGPVYMKRNDDVMCQGWLRNGPYVDTSTCTAIVELEVGDSVQITGSSSDPARIRGGLQSGFTGFLISVN